MHCEPGTSSKQTLQVQIPSCRQRAWYSLPMLSEQTLHNSHLTYFKPAIEYLGKRVFSTQCCLHTAFLHALPAIKQDATHTNGTQVSKIRRGNCSRSGSHSAFAAIGSLMSAFQRASSTHRKAGLLLVSVVAKERLKQSLRRCSGVSLLSRGCWSTRYVFVRVWVESTCEQV